MKVVGINFKEHGRVYYFKAGEFIYKKDTAVIVETEKGLQYGIVVVLPREIDEKDMSGSLKSVLRLVNEEDRKKYQKNLIDSKKAFEYAVEMVKKLNLDMRLLDASYTFDRNQLLFNFIADGRVDFRELAKKLAQMYRTRIELRQIGVRDKAKEIGGLGPCGRFLCCSSFLTDFNSVSINMAKNQFIALNPTKINGVCGRLLCCLNYEDDLYSELKKDLPPIGTFIDTPEGKGRIVSLDIFKKVATVEFKDHHTTTIDFGENK